MKIAVLGTGKMGAAMAKGLTRDGGRIWDIVLTNTTGRLPESLSGMELPCTNSNREAVIGADVVILAVLGYIAVVKLDGLLPLAVGYGFALVMVIGARKGK